MSGLDMINSALLEPLTALLKGHQSIAPLILFGVLVLEGIILTTFIFSGTLMILAAGALIQGGVLSYAHVFLAIFTGLWVGDTVNFMLATRGEAWFRGLAVVRKRAALLSRAETWLARWGVAAIFFSRFLGPSRPFVTFLAGVLQMSPARFHLVTIVSTLLLTAGLLNAGISGGELIGRMTTR